jgi:hypothetical protein
MYIRQASITIFVAFSLCLPAKAQSFNRQDLDCAVAATIKGARAGNDTTRDNSFHELIIFFFVVLMNKTIKPIGQGSSTIDPNCTQNEIHPNFS